MADELPAEVGGGFGAFFHGFLHAIFADGDQSEAGGVFRRGGRVGLGHRQQGDFGRLPAGRPTLAGYSMEQGVSSLAESVVIDKHL